MIGNQLARRNINNYARTTLESQSDEIKAKRQVSTQKSFENLKQNQKHRISEIRQSEAVKTDTLKDIAQKAGVARDTASRVMTINKKIDRAIAENKQIAGQEPEQLKKKLMDGDVSINKAYNAIKLEEKKETIRQAEQKIAEQATNDTKPILYIRDSINLDVIRNSIKNKPIYAILGY